jgi:hypothetical protein
MEEAVDLVATWRKSMELAMNLGSSPPPNLNLEWIEFVLGDQRSFA